MRIQANTLLSQKDPEVIIDHKGETVAFSVSVFTRKAFQKNESIFDQINAYWYQLKHSDQDAIFQIYKKIAYCFENALFVDMEPRLRELIVELEQFHRLESISDWIQFRSNINIPDKLMGEYRESIDLNSTREKTYTRSDYVGLISLAMVLRTLIPIWGEYIYSKRQEVGNRFKEFAAFQLLSNTDLYMSAPCRKLRTYIDSIAGDDLNSNIIINVINSEDFGHWMLALICVRRLSMCDIRGTDPNVMAITSVHKFITDLLRNPGSNYENLVKEKTPESDNGNGENKISSTERYKIVSNLAPGEIVELEHQLGDYKAVAQRLMGEVNEELLTRSLETSSVMMKGRIQDPQITLISWVIKPANSPRAPLYIPKRINAALAGVTEATLWSRGFKYLAILSTCVAEVSDNALLISPLDSKTRVPEEMMAELDRLYPFKRVAEVRRGGMKKNGPNEISLVEQSISNLVSNLTMFSWRATCHEDMLKEVTGSTSRKFPIRPDIKTELTRLVISIGRRDWL